jgi:alcohol dehydrogenase class IV
MPMQFQFATSAQIIFGTGKHREIADLAAPLGIKALLISGSGGAQPERITRLLDDKKLSWCNFKVSGEPTVELILEGVQFAKAQACDYVIAYGGGSVLDSGKAIAAMLSNPGDLLDYLEIVGKNLPLINRSAPMIAIPTTAGTGTEVTRNAVLAVTEKKVKVSLRSAFLLPTIALVDPELTLSMPPAITASSGMDALTQLIEPYVSQRANPMTDLFAREGIQCAGRSLREATLHGDHLAAREEMAWASLLGGMCLANAGLGAVHGFAGPLGGMFEAPHGAVCARLLPFACEMNVKSLRERDPHNPALQRYLHVAQILTGDEAATIEEGFEWMDSLRAELQIPPLASYGITRIDIPQIVEKSKNSSSMKGNPIPLTEQEMSEILLQAL